MPAFYVTWRSYQELNATLVVKIPIKEAIAKVRRAPPIDAEKHYQTDIRAGVINVDTSLSGIEDCPRLAESVSSPDHVEQLLQKGVLLKAPG